MLHGQSNMANCVCTIVARRETRDTIIPMLKVECSKKICIQILWNFLRNGSNPQGWEWKRTGEENQLEKKWVASRAGARPTRSHIYASKRGAWPASLNLSKCLSARFVRFHLEVAASPPVYRHQAISSPANPRNANEQRGIEIKQRATTRTLAR